jgi:hypothetical protein
MKGGVWDLLFIALSMFMLGFGILIAYHVITQVIATTSFTSTAAGVLVDAQSAVATFNLGFIIIFVGLAATTIILAYMVPSHPIFIVTGILTLVVLMVIIPIISNAFGSLAADTQMATAASTFPIITYIMDSMPLWTAVIGMMVIIVMYVKWRNQSSY